MADKESKGTRHPTPPSTDMTTDANTTTRPGRIALLAALAIIGAAGCQNDRDRDPATVTAHGERFPSDAEVRPVDRFVRVQAAAAARTDAALFPHHFDAAGDLNSLGRGKLDLMLQDDAALPLVVHLDLARPGADPVPADNCRQSVRAYLADRGLDESQLQFRDGPNAADSHSARDGLRGLKALQKDPATGDAYNGGANHSAGGAEMIAKPSR